ncbi:MAG: phage shock protein C [Limisphaerales bacterium]
MEVFTMVAIIVVASCAAGVFNNYLKVRGQSASEEDQEEILQEVEALRARVEVLEKIVTDEKYQLKNEIEALERNGG